MERNQEEMRKQLLALSYMQEEEKKMKRGGVFQGITRVSSGIFKIIFAFLKWMVLSAITLCYCVCKLCFGFFFH